MKKRHSLTPSVIVDLLPHQLVANKGEFVMFETPGLSSWFCDIQVLSTRNNNVIRDLHGQVVMFETPFLSSWFCGIQVLSIRSNNVIGDLLGQVVKPLLFAHMVMGSNPRHMAGSLVHFFLMSLGMFTWATEFVPREVLLTKSLLLHWERLRTYGKTRSTMKFILWPLIAFKWLTIFVFFIFSRSDMFKQFFCP